MAAQARFDDEVNPLRPNWPVSLRQYAFALPDRLSNAHRRAALQIAARLTSHQQAFQATVHRRQCCSNDRLSRIAGDERRTDQLLDPAVAAREHDDDRNDAGPERYDARVLDEATHRRHATVARIRAVHRDDE